jgi:hypothetical protein
MMFLAILQFLIITIFISRNHKNTCVKHLQSLPSSDTVIEENSNPADVTNATKSTFENENIQEMSSKSGNGSDFDHMKSFDDLAKVIYVFSKREHSLEHFSACVICQNPQFWKWFLIISDLYFFYILFPVSQKNQDNFG